MRAALALQSLQPITTATLRHTVAAFATLINIKYVHDFVFDCKPGRLFRKNSVVHLAALF